MSNLTNYLEQALYDHLFRGISYTPATAIWVSLHSADPTDAGGTGEITGTAYVRVSVAASTAQFGAHGTTGPGSNTNAITWPTAGGAWGTVTHIQLNDASTAGNPLMAGALAASKTIGSGDTFQIAANDLDVTFA